MGDKNVSILHIDGLNYDSLAHLILKAQPKNVDGGVYPQLPWIDEPRRGVISQHSEEKHFLPTVTLGIHSLAVNRGTDHCGIFDLHCVKMCFCFTSPA